MQFLKSITVLSVALATAVYAAPARPSGPPGGWSGWGQQTSSVTTAPAATATPEQSSSPTNTEATQDSVTTQEAVTTQEPAASSKHGGSQSTAGSSPIATGATTQPTSSASGGNGVTVVNSCKETIYVTVSHNGADGSAQAVAPGGSPHFALTGSDMNLKVGPQTSTGGNIAQVEYSLTGSYLSYDLSLINGNPFQAEGSSLVPSGASGSGTCKAVHCTPGEATCANAYNSNADNATLTCPTNTSLTFTACSG